MADVQILASQSVAAPLDYALPGSLEIILRCLVASYDGTGSGTAFLPAVQIISDSGHVAGTFVAAQVAAGASADVTWFPGGVNPAASAGSGIQFDTDNVGDWLEIETTATVGSAFSKPAALRGAATNYGQAFNANNGFVFTAPANSFFNSGNPVVDIEHYFSTGGYGAYGELVQVQDNTAGGGGGAIGVQISAGSNGTANSEALIAVGEVGAGGTTGDAYGGEFRAGNQGSGKEIALFARTDGHKTGASSLAVLITDSLSNPIFEVRNDGSVHIKTGTTVVADL